VWPSTAQHARCDQAQYSTPGVTKHGTARQVWPSTAQHARCDQARYGTPGVTKNGAARQVWPSTAQHARCDQAQYSTPGVTKHSTARQVWPSTVRHARCDQAQCSTPGVRALRRYAHWAPSTLHEWMIVSTQHTLTHMPLRHTHTHTDAGLTCCWGSARTATHTPHMQRCCAHTARHMLHTLLRSAPWLATAICGLLCCGSCAPGHNADGGAGGALLGRVQGEEQLRVRARRGSRLGARPAGCMFQAMFYAGNCVRGIRAADFVQALKLQRPAHPNAAQWLLGACMHVKASVCFVAEVSKHLIGQHSCKLQAAGSTDIWHTSSCS